MRFWEYDGDVDDEQDGRFYATAGDGSVMLTDIGRNQVLLLDDRTGDEIERLGEPASIRANQSNEWLAYVELVDGQRVLRIR